eukprot:m.223635 g.223635  ORF g.223635 m.223635 type:complete len:626 (+) comp17273_c0_seq4:245-2122(+)
MHLLRCILLSAAFIFNSQLHYAQGIVAPVVTGIFHARAVAVDQNTVYLGLHAIQPSSINQRWVPVWKVNSTNSIVQVQPYQITILDWNLSTITLLHGSNADIIQWITISETKPSVLSLNSEYFVVAPATALNIVDGLTIYDPWTGKVFADINLGHAASTGSAVHGMTISAFSDIVVLCTNTDNNQQQLLYFEYMSTYWRLPKSAVLALQHDAPLALRWLSSTTISLHLKTMAVASFNLTSMTSSTLIAEPLSQVWVIDSELLLAARPITDGYTIAVYRARDQWAHSTNIMTTDIVREVVHDDTDVYFQFTQDLASIAITKLKNATSVLTIGPDITPSATTLPPSSEPKPSSHVGQVVFGIILAAAVAVVLLLGLAYRSYIRRKYKRAALLHELDATKLLSSNDDDLIYDTSSVVVKEGLPSLWLQVKCSISSGQCIDQELLNQFASTEQLELLDAEGRSLLTYACMHGHPQAVTALLSVTEWTVDQVLDVSGHAPVHWACMVGSRSCLKAIARFSPEAADALFLATGTGQTLLHLAVAEGSLEMLVVALESGRGRLKLKKLIHKDNQGETAVGMAQRLGEMDCQHYLETAFCQLRRAGESDEDLRKRSRNSISARQSSARLSVRA